MPISTGESPLGDLKKLLNYIDEAEYAQFRRVKVSALRNERAKGLGPPWTRDGRRVLYSVSGVRDFLAAKTVKPAQTPTLLHGNRRRRSAGGQ